MTRPMPGPPEDCCCRFGNATCQECETRGYPYSWGLCPGCELHNGRDLGAHKRLKDAECAAEYWRASNMCWRTDALGLEDPAGTDLEYQSYTWLAFATHHHALEEA